MNSIGIAVSLICLVLIVIALTAFSLLVKFLWEKSMTTLALLAQRSEAERSKIMEQWAAERQDFLNRLMTKEWQSYAQISQASPSPSEWTTAPEETDRGTGEVLIDLD